MNNTQRALKTVAELGAKYWPHLHESADAAQARQVLETAILAGFTAGQESLLQPFTRARRPRASKRKS